MPRIYSNALIAQTGRPFKEACAWLLDIQCADGTLIYVSDFAGSYPKVLGVAGSIAYQPWLKRCSHFRMTRSLRVDAGDVVLQNLSGNTIERDVSKLVQPRVIEGALCVIRMWDLLVQEVLWDFYGQLTTPEITDDEVTFRTKALFDPNLLTTTFDVFGDLCSLTFGTPPCGSVAGAPCDQTYESCVTAGAVEHFNGMPTVPPNSLLTGLGGPFVGG